jgi:cysteine desulfurase/selenocysteine lyase
MPQIDVDKVRAHFPVLSREVHGRPLVYLDNAATSQKPLAMIQRLYRLYAEENARVEQGHELSLEATRSFEGVRAQVARLINAKPNEIVFCRGATEALNLIARSFGDGVLKPGDEILLTEAEHHSNIVPWILAARHAKATVKAVPIEPSGDLDPSRLEALLSDRVRIVGITHLSNATGARLPVERVVELCHGRGIPVLVDGAQALPHLPVDVRRLGCDFYAGSGHKMGGPSSVGFLYGQADKLDALPLADGGSTMAERVTFDDVVPKPLPHKFEAGEPAFGEVVGWGAGLAFWQELGLDNIAAYVKELTDYAAARLSALGSKVRLLGCPRERLAIVSFNIAGKSAKDVEQALDRQGIAVRAGDLSAQPLLKALGEEAAVRASFQFYNTRAEVDALAEHVERIARGGLFSGWRAA